MLERDWVIDAAEACHIVDAAAPARTVALQRNVDPVVLYRGRDAIEREVERMSAAFKGGAARVGRGLPSRCVAAAALTCSQS